MEQENKSSIGSIFATIIIIAIIILGGLYFWGKRVEESRSKENLITNTMETATGGEANTIRTVSGSDELDSIDADLNSTNLDNLSPELQ
jgi:uncharacterized protein YpmB